MSITSYRGPSGENYIIKMGEPFIVKNKQDIKFFEKNNKRFKKLNAVQHKKAKKKAKKASIAKGNEEETLAKELEKNLSEIKGLTPEAIAFLVKTYLDEKHLILAIEDGGDLGEGLTKEEKVLVKEKYA